MKKICLWVALAAITHTLTAQNVGIGTSSPDEKLEVTGKIKTENFQMTAGAINGYILQSDANGNAVWVAPRGGLIPFSTGPFLNGASVQSTVPILMGFGSQTVETIGPGGESTNPVEVGGFAFTIPHTGMIKSIQISADILVTSIVSINTIPVIYHFTVIRAPSVPNNGICHIASPYLTTPLKSSLTFGGPTNTVLPGTYYNATNINPGSLAVTAGDRICVQVRTESASDPSTSDINQLSFSASLIYAY